MNKEVKREYAPVLDATKLKYVGKILPSNNYGNFEILEYNAVNDVKIKFLDTGFVDTVFASQMHTGRVRDYMKPLIEGKGIIGTKLTTEEYKHKAYKNWVRILMRCYNEKQRYRHPTYSGCSVSEFFLTYTNFRDWYVKQKNWDNPLFVLDKDLLSTKECKVYSEETCVFIPKEINSLLTTTKASRGGLPIGVCKPKREGGKFTARICKENKDYDLGYYEDAAEAFLVYKEAREAYLKEKAHQWKEQLDVRAYTALINYEVEITD